MYMHEWEKNQVFSKYETKANTFREVRRKLWRVFHKVKSSFKINIFVAGVGATGKDPNDENYPGKYAVLHAGGSTTLRARPWTISGVEDFEAFMGFINREQFNEVINRHDRPDSSFTPIGITHFYIDVAKMRQQLGALIEIPKDLKAKKIGYVHG